MTDTDDLLNRTSNPTVFLKMDLPKNGETNWDVKLVKAFNTIDGEIMMLRARAHGNWNHADEAQKQSNGTRKMLTVQATITILMFLYLVMLTAYVVTKP